MAEFREYSSRRRVSCSSPVAVVLAGANCNNGSKCGPRYLNANNVAGDANWNIGASLYYPNYLRSGCRSNNVTIFPHRTVKIILTRGTAGKQTPNAVKGIRKGPSVKSFNGLFDRMCQQEEIAASIKEAAEHKKSRPYVKKIVDHTDEKAEKVLALLKSGNWEPPAHEKTRLCEGSHKKERLIDKPVFDDEQIVHHALMRQLRPILQPRFYRYACGSIPDRGPLYAVRAMKRWRDSYGGKKFYVAELDVKKFYQNIDTEILKAMLVKLIRDKRYLEILCRVIDRTAPGLPLGFYTSPWLGNYYLTPLDRHITQTLRPDHYLRYMDNLFLFHKSKKELHRMVAAISEFMGEQLHLKMKED